MINGKKVVALCTYRIYESQEFAFLSELGRVMQDNDCFLFIYALNSEIGIANNDLTEVAVYDLIPYDKVDVVVIMNEKIKKREVCQNIIDKSALNNVPVIVVDGNYDNVSMVRYNYASGFEKVVRHILEDRQAKRPHFMAGHRNNSFSDERIEVFKKVLSENNMPFDNSMISYGDFWALPCRAATAELLKRDELPDSIICANDIMAINVCDVLKEAGIRVPEDVLVSGFDGIDEAFLSSPCITTAVCDSGELAHAVMHTLIDIFDGKRNITRLVQPVFIPNESSGCSRKDLHVTATVGELNNLFYHHEDEVHAYQSIISKFINGKDIPGCIRYFKENHAKFAQVVVEKSCFNLENNFFDNDAEKGDKVIVYDSYDDSDEFNEYDPEIIIPHLKEIMDIGQPIIFNCLLYMDKCLGFVCYSYPRTMLIDYNQTPNLTNCFEMSIGGYFVTRYQQYLRDKIQEMYQNDALTGLYNRLAFRSKIEDFSKDSSNIGKKITVIMQDLNGLKQINDNLGHLYGDKAITSVAKALKTACPADSICVRAGGDEMLAFIVGDCDVSHICSEIDKQLASSSKELGFTVSASTGTYSTVYDGQMELDKIIGIADERMYAVKRMTKKQEHVMTEHTE